MVSHLAARRAALAMSVPFLTVEGLAAPYLADLFPGRIAEVAAQYAQARDVIAVSEDNLSCLRQVFGLPTTKGRVIHYGRPASFFQPSDPNVRRRLRSEWGIPDSAVLCFTAGRLHPLKGYQHQLRAIELLQKRPVWRELYFAWAGLGQLQGEIELTLERLGAASHVKLLGRQWDIAAWLDAADIFVLPTEAEGMPLAVMEAMAKGLPVVASAVNGIPEELGPAGKLLPPPQQDVRKTVTVLAATLEAWAANPDLRLVVGQAGRARAETMFREERMVAETMAVIERALVPPGDYVSPGLAIVRPDRCFPHMQVGDPQQQGWPYLRRHIPHNWYVDRRWPSLGWLSRDEAHLLYHNARQFRGRPALEIGCFMGWSTCHLALTGVELDVVDPLLGRSDVGDSVRDSLRKAGVFDSVRLVAGTSPQAVEKLASRAGRRWSLFFIDGDHNAPAPLRDAQVCARLAAPDAMILFHDLAAPDVAQGLEYLRQQGWQTQIYQTMQIMGVAWRGNVRPVAHTPDPSVAWDLPEHLRQFTLDRRPATVQRPAQPAPLRCEDSLLQRVFGWIDELSVASAAPPGPLDRDRVEQVLQAAQECVDRNDAPAAIKAFSQVCAANPDSALAHTRLASLHWQQGHYRESLHHHMKAQVPGTLGASRQEFQEILGVVKPYTLVSEERLFSLYCLARQLCLDDVPGNFVECGTCKGGSAALLATVIRRYSRLPRQLLAFDTFEGMPEPTVVDEHRGIPAEATPFGTGALRATVEENLRVVCKALGVEDLVVPVEGLFADTLPQRRPGIDAIALMHADADWYESTRTIFEWFYDLVAPQGVVQVDDYGFWEGCRRAVHEFEQRRGLAFGLRSIDEAGAWFRKDEPGDGSLHWRKLWYFAQMAEQFGDRTLARQAASAVFQIIPNLIAARQMHMRLQ